MNKEMSLDVALDIIGTLRMMKIDEISNEADENRKKLLQKELSVLNTEEKIANGLLQFEVSENVRLSVMDKIQNYYAPKLKAYYATLWSGSHLWTKKDGLFEDINISSQKPIAIILGGQPACGKSTLINVAKKDHPNLDFSLLMVTFTDSFTPIRS